ncbi:MAG: DUF3488 domain-containing protein [Ketobacter sp.]|nr:MAG: DUF3488 domain-containing protein [Ketobacter sp.]
MGGQVKHQPVFPMPRTAFVLLVLCVALAIMPHVSRLPIGLLPVFLGVLIWRIQIFRQRLRFPHRLLRLGLVMLAFFGVVFHHGTIFGPDAGVSLLITAYVFKLLEMYTKRDAFLIIILSYFVLATEFLFSFSIFSSAYVLVVLIFITAALIALNQTDATIVVWRPLKKALILFLQAIPLLVALSLLFPRIGPVWQLNLSKGTSTVGLSDRVSPGDIAELSRSDKLAFRVEFEGQVPDHSQRYWRAVVFDRFDGRTWYAMDLKSQSPLYKSAMDKGSRSIKYRVLLNATGQNWLITMPWAEIDKLKHFPTDSLMQFYQEPINTNLSYEVISYPDYQYKADKIGQSEYQTLTSLPGATDPQSRRYADRLFEQAGYDPERYSDKLLNVIFTGNFVYTLRPPRLGINSIDDFLFNTQKGFCAHYAGAYVFLMRAVGIPARMVGGYQGGTLHPIGGYLLVHQYDAHAWAEYWVQGKGWVRVDPTAAVAPSRIEFGPLNDSSDRSFLDDSPLSPDKLRNIALIARMRLFADYVDYLWVKNVVSYNKESQSDLFAKLLGKVTPQRIALLMGGVGAAVLLLMAGIVLIDRRNLHRLERSDRLVLKLIKKLDKSGIVKEPGEGLASFLRRVKTRFPEQSGNLEEINQIVESIKYSNSKNLTNLTLSGNTPDDTLRELEKALSSAIERFKP